MSRTVLRLPLHVVAVYVLLCAPGAVLTLLTPCNSSRSCSLNGACIGGACRCDQGWVGVYCQQLELLPVANGTGLDCLHDSAALTSTWGGTILHDSSSGIWHMWASEMLEHCGIHSWVQNSVVVHATADRADGKYTRQEVVFEHFSHEPSAARAPTGEFVLYITHNSDMNTSNPIGKCTDGSSGPCPSNGCHNGNCNWGRDPKKPLLQSCTMQTFMSYATNAAGPWSTLVPIPTIGPNPYADLNFAPIIEADGSLLGWTRDGIVRAKNWRNVSGYRLTGKPMADKHYDKTWGEDPFLWKDQRRGGYHILSHGTNTGDDAGQNQMDTIVECTPGSTVRGCQPGPEGDCGRHFFSETGSAGTWEAAPLPNKENGGCSYWRMDIPFADGHNRTFWRRERPHLAIEADGTLAALTTGTMDRYRCCLPA